MVELQRVHPLQPWVGAFAELPAASLTVTVEPYLAMVDVGLRGAAPDLLQAVGIALPTVPNTWRSVPGGRAVWLGPDEWLVTSTEQAPDALESGLREHLVPQGGSATDVSAQRIAVRLSGPRSREVLAKGCSLDLHPRVFGTGDCAQTTLARAGVVLLGLSDTGQDFLLLVRSSFAGYVAEWLLDAALEYQPASTA